MKKILVIEDETAIRETLVEILQMSDFEVMNAENGKIGLEKAKKGYPDLVICDVMMPIMNGLSTVEAFKNHPQLKFIPFVFLSALNEMSDVRRGMNSGAEDYLTKPFKSKELLYVINNQLNKSVKKDEIAEERRNYCSEKIISQLKDKICISESKWQETLKSAGRIQSVILPKTAEVKKIFPDCFNYYRPKYSVSGDFYWVQNFKNSKLVAVADCTGHGIPASLLTICCYNGLNLAVKHFGLRKPAEILRKVNELVTDFMKEHDRNLYDVGMDIAICSIDEKKQTIKYVGAKRPVYLISNKLNIDPEASVRKYDQKQSRSLYRVRGSLYTVGSLNEDVKLEEHQIKYESGDLLYLSSDGYSDQFGGIIDKRFKSQNLIQLLISIQNESMEEQKRILAQTFSLWKGDTEQTDDVTLLGIKL